MFYDKYLDEFYLEELFDNYDPNYLKNIDQNNFEEIYQLLKKYNFDYIDDIILEYLDIFTLPKEKVEEKILNLQKALGKDYVEIIGDDISYLEYITKQ